MQKPYFCDVYTHTESPDGQRLGRRIHNKGDYEETSYHIGTCIIIFYVYVC